MGISYVSRKNFHLCFLRDLHYYLSSISLKSLPSLSSNPQSILVPLTPFLSFTQFHTISSSDCSTPVISSSGSSSFPSTSYPSSRVLNGFYLRWFRSSSSSSSSRLNASRKQISEIINLIKSSEKDLESKLNGMNVSLSEVTTCTIFGILNCQKISALRFFNWIRQFNPEFYHNSEICSLVIDNCGRLDDFDSMFNLLNEFRIDGISLNHKAFGYLSVMISSKAAVTEKSICKVVEVLDKIGGCYGISGIHILIGMLCDLGSFEMAHYVIGKTQKRVSNYSILVRERCRRGHFEEARQILYEMIKLGCNPSSNHFNYVLSCLYKYDKTAEAYQFLEQMLESGCPPDALTFEIFICYCIRLGKLDAALKSLDKMESIGIEPRATTHAIIVKCYFNLQRYQEAHQYVIACSDKYKVMSNMVYSLLASLHRKRGKPVIAHSILSEMIEKGLKPNFAVYRAVREQLQKSGREDMASNLERRFSSLNLQPGADNGC